MRRRESYDARHRDLRRLGGGAPCPACRATDTAPLDHLTLHRQRRSAGPVARLAESP